MTHRNILIIKLILVLVFIANISYANEDYTWIQYVDKGSLSARAITINDTCPQINIDGKNYKMNLRTALDDEKLKETVQVCEYDVTKANSVKINNQNLKLPPTKVNRFVAIGDTGCQYSPLDNEYRHQICNKKDWPLENISNQISKLNPDFIIHTGDYVYRDKYTAAKDKMKNLNMQWYFFKQDFFDPTKAMLKTAPILFLRGNHESCKYAGKGWFSFMGPREFRGCSADTPSYLTHINDLKFIIFDSSGNSRKINFSQEHFDMYKKDFNDIYNNINDKYWLLTHKPMILPEQVSDDEIFSDKLHSHLIEAAFKSEYADKIPVAISGHYHLLGLIKRKSNNFTQLIIGNSGSKLITAGRTNYNFISEDGDDNTIMYIEYGYTVFDRIEDHLWKVTSYNVQGDVILTTNLSTKQ